MLSPKYYDELSNELIKLYSDLDNAIISDIVRRLLKNGNITDTAKWQIEKLQESGMLYDDVLAEISKHTNATSNQVRALFEDAGVLSIKNDNIRYHAAGLEGIIKMSPAAMQVLNAGYIQCAGDLKNLTLTTANTSQQAYINACNNAYMQITSGAFDYNTAIRNAVKTAAEEGTEVLYPSGHRDKLDVAIRRATLTGVGQTCRTLSEINAQDMGCDLMEITAHSGARPSHAEWQGQIVSLSGRRGYLSKSDIGYGTGDGFGGWNCRHDWYPYFEGISSRAYNDVELKRLNERNIEYNGNMYTEYEASQIQRKFERDIRQLKREAVAADTGRNNAENDELKQIFNEDFTKTSVKLKDKEQQLGEFLNQTKMLPDNARTQVLGFGKSISQKAAWADKKSPLSLTKFLNDDTIADKGTAFKKNLELGRFNTKIEDNKQKKHLLTPEWRNQVKQAISSNGKQTPKSRLNKNIDPQEVVNKYGGTGRIVISGDGKTVNEFITLPYNIGKTYNNKTGKFVDTKTAQIKYSEKGTHVFPTKEMNKDDVQQKN